VRSWRINAYNCLVSVVDGAGLLNLLAPITVMDEPRCTIRSELVMREPVSGTLDGNLCDGRGG
jgi:hypothetical protein